MNPPVTLTYSTLSSGWTSRWSFIPDWMIGMNNTFYTWSDGNLYKHDTNVSRNTFYGTQYPSSITTVLNESPTEIKMFKTLAIDSDKSWDAVLLTDLENGIIDDTYFKAKEGEWYAFIRRPDNNTVDTASLSVQGIGALTSFTSLSMSFPSSYNIETKVSVTDRVYTLDGLGQLVYLGQASGVSSSSISFSSLVGPPLFYGMYILIAKNNMVESYGLRGYYMQVELTMNTPKSTQEFELFAIDSSVFKSYP
jgi:hypothetical protein